MLFLRGALRGWIGATLVSMIVTGATGCSGKESTVPLVSTASAIGAPGTVGRGTLYACDGIRRHLRQIAFKSFGFDLMASQMKKVSREISREERDDLGRFTVALDTIGIDPELRTQAVQRVQETYSEAIRRAGFNASVLETHADIGRAINANPAGFDPLFDGFTLVLSSTPAPAPVAAAGLVSEVYLAVNADQSRYEFILLKLKSVEPGPNGGTVSTGDYITMADYVETHLPKSCVHVGTAMQPAQLNQMSAN